VKLTRYILPFLLTTALNCSAQTIDTVSVEQEGAIYKVENTPGSTYLWTIEGGQMNSPNGYNFIVVNWGNVPGIYNISVLETNKYSCTGKPVIRQVYVEPKKFPLIDGRATICLGEQIILTASGEEPLYHDLTYLWNTGETTRSITVKPTHTTHYSCIVDYNGDVQDTAYFTVKVNPPFHANFSMDPNKPIVNEIVRFNYIGSPATTYQWDVNYPSDSTDWITDPAFEHSYKQAGIKVIRLVAMNEFGCTDTLFREFLVSDPYALAMPTAFTPNDDGRNDRLQFDIPEAIRTFTYRVFNRWGEMVFVSNERSNSWDGYHQNIPAPEGAYVIVFEGIDYEGKRVDYSGTISLHR
jgi:gliding motility-associated-like protein